jgi:hypothetical protein
MENDLKKLASVMPGERILLLPHCLRQSNSCAARYDQEGLQCAACNSRCSVNILKSAALEYGYKGVCVAPGGRLAIKYIKEKRPAAIVAVACAKELMEGVEGVKALAADRIDPLIVIIPLSKDGCLDTEVAVEEALEVIRRGCLTAVGGKLA